MNPCRKQYTDDEWRRIHDGQQALLAKWRAPPFSLNQTPNYRVVLGELFMDGDQVSQEISVLRGAKIMTAPWEQELARLGLKAEYTDAGEFRIYVPHAYYLRRRWIPWSWDWACVGSFAVQSIIIGLLLGTSWTIGM